MTTPICEQIKISQYRDEETETVAPPRKITTGKNVQMTAITHDEMDWLVTQAKKTLGPGRIDIRGHEFRADLNEDEPMVYQGRNCGFCGESYRSQMAQRTKRKLARTKLAMRFTAKKP